MANPWRTHGFAVQDLQALCKPLGFSLLTAELNELKDPQRSSFFGGMAWLSISDPLDLFGTEYLESQLPTETESFKAPQCQGNKGVTDDSRLSFDAAYDFVIYVRERSRGKPGQAGASWSPKAARPPRPLDLWDFGFCHALPHCRVIFQYFLAQEWLYTEWEDGVSEDFWSLLWPGLVPLGLVGQNSGSFLRTLRGLGGCTGMFQHLR